MVSLRGVACVETASESLSWQEEEIDTWHFSSVLEQACTLTSSTLCTTRSRQRDKSQSSKSFLLFYVCRLLSAGWN